MRARITPAKINSGNITIPPSKSLAHRAIICACLAPGRSVISNIDYSVDIRATIEGMRHFGASIKEDKDTLFIDGIETFQYDGDVVNCHESGSTLRFFLPHFSPLFFWQVYVLFPHSQRLRFVPQMLQQLPNLRSLSVNIADRAI